MQQALVAEQAIQCGFCTPGIVMNGAALLARNANPDEAEIKQAITNLCRCGVYPRLVRAIQLAGRAMRREETLSAATAPGISVSRSEEHTSELQSLMRISYAVFCLKKKTNTSKKYAK